MESEFEPVVRTEETSVARTAVLDVPGFRKEDLRVQVDNRGNMIISGEERRVKETEKMQRGSRKFRKIISLPENLNVSGITAKFKDETLHITLPLLPISDQKNQKAVPESRKPAVPASGKPDQFVDSKVQRSNPAGQEESMKERSGVAQDDQRAKQPEVTRQEDDKVKGAVAKAAEVSKGLEEERKTEAPKLAQGFVHGEPPISKDAIQKRSDDQTSRHPEVTQPEDHKAKSVPAAGESKELAEGKNTEAPKLAEDIVGSPQISKDPVREISAAAKGDQSARDTKANRQDDDIIKAKAAAEESKELRGRKIEAPKQADDIAAGALISKDPKQELPAISQGDRSARQAEAILPEDDKLKAKAAAEESKELLGVRKFEVPKHGQDIAAGALISKEPKQELSAVSQGDQGARQAETIRPDDVKSEPKAGAEESKELLRGKEEVPKHARDLVGAGEPVSKEPKQQQFAVALKEQSRRHPEAIQPADLKEASSAAVHEEPKEWAEKENAETPNQAKGFVHEDPTILSPTQAVAAQTGSDRDKPQFIQSSKKDEEKLQQEGNSDEDEEGEQADDEVEEETEEEEDDSDESRLPIPSDEFPHRVIQIPSSFGPSMFSKEKVLLASTVLALSVGLFVSYMLSLQ